MPVDFLAGEQQRRYGRHAGEPSPAPFERYFHPDDKDRGLIARCRGDHTRLGFAVQLGTVRFLGTLLTDPSEVPQGMVDYLARQPGIADTGGLERYAAGEMRRDHVTEIRRRYGYRLTLTPLDKLDEPASLADLRAPSSGPRRGDPGDRVGDGLVGRSRVPGVWGNFVEFRTCPVWSAILDPDGSFRGRSSPDRDGPRGFDVARPRR